MSALTLTASQRSALRGLAHGLDARVHIGQQGVSASVLAEIDSALRAHGLIKVRVLEAERADREAMLEEIANALFCAPVQHIGRMLVLWRPRPQDAVQLKVEAPSMKDDHRATKAPSKSGDRPPRRTEGGRASPTRVARDERSSNLDESRRRAPPRRPDAEAPARSRATRSSESPRFSAEAPRPARPRSDDTRPSRPRADDAPRRPSVRRDEQDRTSARPPRTRDAESARARDAESPRFVAEAAPRRREGGSLKAEWFKGGDRASTSNTSERSAPSARAPRSSTSDRSLAKPRTRSSESSRGDRSSSPRGRKPSR